MRFLYTCLVCFFFQLSNPVNAQETYDLIFKNGTLSDIAKESILVYDRNIQIREQKEASEREVGKIQLSFEPEDMARLKFHKGEKFRNLGEFPATVGNPIIMYFVESVIRDVSRNAGGSPFYIRNRIKASLLQKVPIEDVALPFGGNDIPAKQITLRPFLNDKNRSKMRGYEDLALTITMSDKVPGWYYSLVADTKPSKGEGPVYTNALKLVPERTTQ